MQSTASIPSTRDSRLDVLRGLCLIDMVLVHLVDQGAAVPWLFGEVAMHWLRFAAGGFIFASGLCVGAIHFHKSLQPGRRLGIHGSLLQRAGIVLLAHYFTAFLLLLQVPLGGVREYHVADYVRDVLLLWTGYDLLLFYVVMLLLSPLLIELRRWLGPLPLLAGSLSLFFLFHDRPYLMLYPLENHFPILHWQAVFVVGFVAGTALPRYDGLGPATKRRIWLAAFLVAVSISLLSFFERQAGSSLSPWLTVSKLPLSYLELARYLALALVVGVGIDLGWKWLAGTRSERLLALVGSYSLLLWVVHGPIVSAFRSLPWLGGLVLSVVAVVIVARFARRVSRGYASVFPAAPRLGYAAPVLGSLVVVGMLQVLSRPGTMDMDEMVAHGEPRAGMMLASDDDDAFPAGAAWPAMDLEPDDETPGPRRLSPGEPAPAFGEDETFQTA